MKQRMWARAECAALLALIALCLLWEGWLAPLRPGGSMLILKCLPLVPAIPGVLRGRRYTSQWLTMAALLYFLEGAWRFSDPAPAGTLARVEIALSLVLYVAAVGHARASAPSRQKSDTIG
ncbi:MAG: DUF2069 domain-containing protein [Azoarcus sp.]|jgi:uncharacterized membrane protein|nr:DUF2069 domain-containing protein [Azoarcus sp.]